MTRWRATAALGLGGLLMAALILRATRGTTFYFDEWDFILRRRTGVVGAFLRPHNGHLSLVPVALYRFLFATVGLHSYLPYRLLVIAVHLGCVALVYLYASRRVGEVVALLAAGFVLVLGSAWQDLLWPFQIGYLVSVGAGVGALLLLDRNERRFDRAGAAALALAVASSGIGVPFAAVVAVEMTLQRQWRRLWVVAAPALLYGAWYVVWGESQAQAGNITRVPGFAAAALAAAVGGILGTNLDWGRHLSGAFAALVAVHLATRRRVPPRLVALGFGAAAFWALTALSRAGVESPAASRYVYPGAVFVVLITVEILRDRRPPPRGALVLVGVVLVLASVSNLRLMGRGGGGLRDNSSFVSVELRALESLGTRPADGFLPDPTRMPQVTAGRYRRAIAALGSPAPPWSAVVAAGARQRARVDDVLVRGFAVRLRSGTGPPPCTDAPHTGERAVRAPARVVVIGGSAPSGVSVRSAADRHHATPVGFVEVGQWATVELPETDSPLGWFVRGTSGDTLTCLAR